MFLKRNALFVHSVVSFGTMNIFNNRGESVVNEKDFELLYKQLNDAAIQIEQHEHIPYLDALGLAMEYLFFGESSLNFDDILLHKLNGIYESIDLDTFEQIDIRKGVQLAIIKGMKHTTQSQHMITPESISLLIGYLAEKFTKDLEHVRVLDPVVGTGSLLLTVLSQLHKETKAYSAEIDPTLIKLAVAYTNLQKSEVEFFHQDALRPLFLDPVDLVVADLPVGYYPDDVHAEGFELNREDSHAYAHELLIEQSLQYMKPGGYGIFVIPDTLFDDDTTGNLNRFINQEAYIVGLLRLPESAFKTKKQVKSIFILQKRGHNSKMPKEPLLVQLPSFKNAQAMESIMKQINQWFEKYEQDTN